MPKIGDLVFGRLGSTFESVTGVVRSTAMRCRLEGCNGHRVTVLWPDGRRTMPCSEGLTWLGGGVLLSDAPTQRWRII